MYCKCCGENMIGDGYLTIIHCPYAEYDDWAYHEPDANPVYCTEEILRGKGE